MADQLTYFLDPAAPTVFADSVINFANSEHVVKFYLARLDPAMIGVHDGRATTAAQVVMPIDAFVQSFAFLERSVAHLRNSGVIPQDMIDKARKVYESEQ